MKTTKFLYGCNPADFADLPYRKALEYKIKMAKIAMHNEASFNEKLYKSGAKREEFQRSEYRLTQIKRAIEWNEKLRAELEE